MFVYTWKLPKKAIVLGILALIVVVAAIVLIISLGGRSAETSAPGGVALTNEDRVAYLKSLGWDVETEPVESAAVTIPKEFGEVYKQYADIQSAQGFDLKSYAGKECTRYTYRVLNYPGEDAVVADIIVYKGKVIAGDVQSAKLGGFMQGLEFPKS